MQRCKVWQRDYPVMNELPVCHSWSRSIWERLSKMAGILSFILMSATDTRLSSSLPTTELAFLTSLLSWLPLPALMPPSQNSTAKNRELARLICEDPNVLRKNSLLRPSWKEVVGVIGPDQSILKPQRLGPCDRSREESRRPLWRRRF